ncbi:hypothetical protein M9Y10_038737 [Tritrichomonas musculus]|uniref:Protein kinase domain-containing protein n=1 Tax=Tritrichomonas musculus TaxID=1915356 RepID=A0ABR2K990_9EUKA
MLPSNLPTSLTQWRRYFDVTFKLLEEVVPTISLGYNKIDLILTNLQAFRTSFLTDHQPTVTPKESWILFEFFKTCAAFISYSSQYNSKKILHYIISHPINGQYNEIAELYNSWSVQSSMLLCDSFRDITLLSYAHYLDLIAIRDSFGPIVDSFPQQVSTILKRKLENISKLFKFMPQAPKNKNIKIFDHSQIIKGEKIDQSQTSFAQFFKARIKPSTDCTIIEFSKICLSNNQVFDFKYKLNSYFNFNHPNIIYLQGATDKPPYCVLLNNLISNSLFDLLHNEGEKNKNLISQSQKLKIALGIIRGLEYLESMKFVHKDLNSKNILLDSNFNPLISFFAINTQRETENCGWISPEVLSEQKQQYSCSADIYTFGVILWELLTGEKPYEKLPKSQLQIAEMVIDKDIRPNIPANATIEISELIQSCWASNPKKRPKASDIRIILEGDKQRENKSKYIKFYSNDNIDEYVKWADETKEEHTNIINSVNKAEEMKEAHLINILSQPQSDIPSTLFYLHELHNYSKTNITSLIETLVKVINQNTSYSVQEETFSLIKEILNRDDIDQIIDPLNFIDRILQIVGNQPKYMITLAKEISPKIQNIDLLVKKFISMPKTHFSVEIIKTIISVKTDQINPRTIVKIYESIPDDLSLDFLMFILTAYGPLEVFFPPSCKSIQLISLFVSKLSTFCEDFQYIQKVKDIINIDEISTMSEFALRKVLDSVSKAILKEYDYPVITREMGLIMFYFIVQYCIKFNQAKTALKVLNICLLSNSMRTIMSQSNIDIWTTIIKAVNFTENINTQTSQKVKPSEKVESSEKIIEIDSEYSLIALHLINEIPLCKEPARFTNLWNCIVLKYRMTKKKNVTKTICSILDRKSDVDLHLLMSTLNEGIAGDDDHFCLTALKILRHINISILSQFLKVPPMSNFWPNLTKQMKKQNGKICKSIGKLAVNMIEKMPDFQLYPSFLRSIIELIYNKMTSFDTSMPFIFFLGDAIKIREVILYLQRESFVKYLQQLIWRYENDPRVAGVVDYFTSSLKQHYSQM